jgi:HAMP domain-containing protein
MDEQAPSTTAASAPPSPAAPPILGLPSSDLRWLMPIVLCVGVFVLMLPLGVFMPLGNAVEKEPDPAVEAVLADSLFLLHVRLWMIVLTGAVAGGAFAIAGARQSAKALLRLELRLRRIADGDVELPPTDPARDFARFDEVFEYLRAGIDRTTRRNRGVLQKVQRPLRLLSQQLAAGEVARDELRKSVSAALNEVDSVLDMDRRSGAAKARS